jgi:hypothetical protein
MLLSGVSDYPADVSADDILLRQKAADGRFGWHSGRVSDVRLLSLRIRAVVR